MRAICIVLSLVIRASSADLLELLSPTLPETPVPVEILVAEENVLTKPLAVVFVTNALSDPQADALAKLTSGRTVPVSIFVAQTGIIKDLLEGSITVFRAGLRKPYHGVRDAATILKFVSSFEDIGIKTIANKLDKVAFDRTKGTKLVGYFAPASDELAVFENAANIFGSQVSFFTVTDAVVAKHLKLNVTGQIYLVREFDKTPMSCPANPASLVDIQQLIVRNKESFVKVTAVNVRDPSFTKSPSILLITDSSPLSYHLLKLVARSNRDHTQIRPRILWIEVDDFPNVDLKSHPVNGPVTLPGLGFLDPSTNSVQWMDLAILNAAPSDRLQEDANLLLIKAFIASKSPPSAPSVEKPSAIPEVLKSEL